jgi:Tfp pilus assembly protein PilF
VAAEAYRNLGVLSNQAGQPDQAMQYFLESVRLKAAYPEVHQDLGIMYLQKQMPNEAVDQFRTTLQLQPDNAPAALNLAAAYQMKGDVPAAKQTLQTFLQQYGNANSPFVAQARQRLGALP